MRNDEQNEVELMFIIHRSSFIVSQWSRGPAATTPGSHPGNDGSSPSGITAGWTGEAPAGSHKPSDAGSIPAPAI